MSRVASCLVFDESLQAPNGEKVDPKSANVSIVQENFVDNNIQSTHEKQSQESHAHLESHVRLEVEVEGDGEDDDVENHVHGSMAVKGAGKLSRRPRSVTPAFGAGRRVPKIGNGPARKQGQDGVCKPPQGDQTNGEERRFVRPGAFLENSQILEEERELDKGGGHVQASIEHVKGDEVTSRLSHRQ